MEQANINLEDSIVYRYELEIRVMNLITSGNVEGMKILIKDLNHLQSQGNEKTIIRRILTDPLRDRKNGLVIRNTFCRIAARNGGLPPLYQHHISEKYALIIEKATSIDYLVTNVANAMFLEYVEAVHKFTTLPYSKLIKDVVSFITQNLTSELGLTMLAEWFHVHPAHLSRKFKHETGLTLIDYIHHHRINHAKLLFQEGNTNILDVATSSGFNSSSYFNKVFKKVTSQTPSSYLKENQLITANEN